MKYKNFMQYAIKEAENAAMSGEVPVGAVIVCDGEVISSAHNICEKENALCHAEIIAINDAFKKLNVKYLDKCDIYVTLEPCAMCAGAIINSRIKRVYIGALDEKGGCCGSKHNLIYDFFKKTEVYHGICEDECKKLLTAFFKEKR